MRRYIGIGSVEILGTLLLACAAEGRVHVGARTAEPTGDQPTTAGEPPPAAATPAPSTAPAEATSAPATLPGCALVCSDAHHNRVTKEAEAQLASGVSSELSALHGCTRGGPAPTLTLRFDSAGTLTHFGVDDELSTAGGVSGSTCVDSVRTHRPALSFPGPATLRCAERCKR